MWRTFSISFSVVVAAALFFGFFSLGGWPSSGTKLPRVDADFNAISSSIKTYRLNAGHYPTIEQGLKALVEQPVTNPPLRRWTKTADRIPTDPWNNEYRYRLLPEEDERGFELLSAGKDGQFGTEDDLSSLDPES